MTDVVLLDQVLRASAYFGVGSLTVQTDRGDLKALSGDLILHTDHGNLLLTPQQAVQFLGEDQYEAVVNWQKQENVKADEGARVR